MNLRIATSTASDGTMKSLDQNYASILPARTAFLQKNDIDPADTSLVHLTYGGTNYCRYLTLNNSQRGDGIVQAPSFEVDGLVTTQPSNALFLPLADCIGAVLYDTKQSILMVTHLGRHNLEQIGGTRSVEYLSSIHGSDPLDITAWLSPAAGGTNYPLHAFNNRSMHSVAHEQLTNAGILLANITTSPVDTTVDKIYFSHSEFLKGHRDSDGRFAIVAVMR